MDALPPRKVWEFEDKNHGWVELTV